jgi:hypothetical protein
MEWFKKIFQAKAKVPAMLTKHPFPPLTKDVFGDGNLFHWTGNVNFA